MLFIAVVLTATVSCSRTDEPLPQLHDSNIVFTLSYPEYVQPGDNVIAATAAESKIYGLTAVIVKDSSICSVVAPEMQGSGYAFNISGTGDYELYIVANGGPGFNSGISSMGEGTPLEEFLSLPLKADAETGLQPMVSDPVGFSITESASNDLGEIILVRPTVRIDVINAVNGLDITSFRIMDAVDERSLGGFQEKKDIEIKDMDAEASFDNPAYYLSSAYLFESGDTQLELCYTYNGKEDVAVLAFSEEGVTGDMIAGFVLSEEYQGAVTVSKIAVPWSKGYETSFENPLKDYPVSVALTGAASYPKTHEHIIHPFENECAVMSQYFVFFRDGLFYDIKEGEKYGENMFETVINEPGEYDINILANPSDELLALIGELEAGVSTDEEYSDIVVTQAPDEEYFLMVSDFCHLSVYSEELNPLQRVEMYRNASRIDIINAVDGLEIERVIFDGRADKSLLIGSDGNGMTGQKVYENEFGGEGSSSDYLVFDGIIYTYSNTSSSHSLKIEYMLDGEKSAVSVTMPGEAIERNSLYSIVLQEGSYVIAKVYEEDWSLGYTPVVSVSQEAMNAALAVNHFSGYNVMSINGNNVEFCQTVNSLPYTDPGASLFSEWDGAFANSVWTASDGGKYRLPSKAEWMLLIPADMSFNFTKTSASKKDVEEALPEILFDGHNGGQGTSDYASVNEKGNPGGIVWYGLRFKGTDQYSIYRYECFNCDEGSANAYLAVQIKALASDTEIPSLLEYAKPLNPGFWEKDYIEITIPLGGTWMFGEQFLIGQSATYWTQDGSSMMITLPNTGYFDGADTEKANLKLVREDNAL